MAKLFYGVWNGEIYDYRRLDGDPLENHPDLLEFSEFGGRNIKTYVGPYGFLVFDRNISLTSTFKSYLQRAADESCGKCTPCRVGLRVLLKKLENLQAKDDEQLNEIQAFSQHVAETSSCGLGQTSTIALNYALDLFPESFSEAKNIEDDFKFHHHVTAPCIEACPAKVDVPKYIQYLQEGKTKESLGVVLKEYPFAATCGRVCVRLCEENCARGKVDQPIAIKALKRVPADQLSDKIDMWFDNQKVANRKKEKVAVVGAGPAGLTCAYHLLLNGYGVEIFEALADGGGMGRVGIPNYRLPADVVDRELAIVEKLGGIIHYNKRLGNDISIEGLQKDFQSIFLATGAHKGKSIGALGEEESLQGYQHGVEFLLDVNNATNNDRDHKLSGKVYVVGGGNVAMDCVRSAKRLGAEEVHLIYRRTEHEMPADGEEIEAAHHEGIIFHELTHPVSILSENGKITGIELVDMELVEPDKKGGRRGVKIVEGSNYKVSADMLIPAIGQVVDPNGLSALSLTRWGTIKTDTSLMTDIKGVFAGGDCQIGPCTLVESMAQGTEAAKSIIEFLEKGEVSFNKRAKMSKLYKSSLSLGQPERNLPLLKKKRQKFDELDPEVRTKSFDEVEMCMDPDHALKEAERCLRCYHHGLVVTEQ